MAPSVLVAFATKHGSTQEVAERIAGVLAEHGLRVELAPAGTVSRLEGFDAVVLGGALYMGRWHGDARAFLRRHRNELEQLRFAAFGMGPKTLAEQDVEASRAQLLRALGPSRPATTAIFGGVVDPTKLRFPLDRLPATDARDWDAIDGWAREVAGLVATVRPAPVPV